MVTLPDLFVALRIISPIREFCLEMHNGEKGIERMSRVGAGLPWRLHREQDITSHTFEYTDSDRIPKGAIMLFSGGLDSFCQWRLLGQPKAVYFAIGHPAESREIQSIERIREKFGGDITISRRLNVGDCELPSGYIPFRNLFFIMLASIMSPDVVIAQIAEWAPDKNVSFYRHTEHLLRSIGKGSFQGIDIRPKVHAPFRSLTKTQLVRRYLSRWPADDLSLTISCYSGDDIPCGKCTACISRRIAMVNNGIWEEHQNEPSTTEFQKKMSIRDFKFSQLSMYWKRWKEGKEFRDRSI